MPAPRSTTSRCVRRREQRERQPHWPSGNEKGRSVRRHRAPGCTGRRYFSRRLSPAHSHTSLTAPRGSPPFRARISMHAAWTGEDWVGSATLAECAIPLESIRLESLLAFLRGELGLLRGELGACSAESGQGVKTPPRPWMDESFGSRNLVVCIMTANKTPRRAGSHENRSRATLKTAVFSRQRWTPSRLRTPHVVGKTFRPTIVWGGAAKRPNRWMAES